MLSINRCLPNLCAIQSGGDRIRTYSAKSTRFTVWPGSPTPAHPLLFIISNINNDAPQQKVNITKMSIQT